LALAEGQKKWPLTTEAPYKGFGCRPIAG
jgi:hypothetical protein